VEQAVKDVVENIFEDYSHINVEAFRKLISELTENVLVHSEAIYPGYTGARQLSQKEMTYEITIADSGIGLTESYLSGEDDDLRRRVERGASAIDLAMEGLNSSKKLHKGFGFWIVKRLVEEARGSLQIISGEEAVYVSRGFETFRNTLQRPHNGTFIAIILDLANPLHLEEIWEEAQKREVPDYVRQATNVVMSDPPEPETKSWAKKTFSRSVTTVPTTEPKGVLVDLSEYGSLLLTRDIGKTIRYDLAMKLASGAKLIIDMNDVVDITPSVPDECFGKLAESLAEQDIEFRTKVSFQNTSKSTIGLINLTIGLRTKRD
jgi:hypothetical protein